MKPMRTILHRCSQNRFPTTRSGFTLVEAMLAAALAGLLMAAVYAAMDQSWKMTSSGREEMERAQLARALIRRIELDVRAITYTAPPPTDDTGTGSSSTSSSSSSSSTSSSTPTMINTNPNNSTSGSNSGTSGSTVTGSNSSSNIRVIGGGPTSVGGQTKGSQKTKDSSNTPNTKNLKSVTESGNTGSQSSSSSSSSASSTATETEIPPPNSKSIGIRGTETQMEMSIIRPRKDLLPGTTAPTLLRTSDLRQVTYSFGTPGGTGAIGLVRSEGDRMAVETVEAGGGMASQIAPSQMLAPEVIAVTFRYFDGRTWQVSWDSDTNLRLPRAVEVSIRLTEPKRKAGILNVAVSRSMETFRSVIMIPISDPYPQEFVQ